MPVEDNGLSAKDSGHGISLADKGGRVRAGFFLSESGSANVVLAALTAEEEPRSLTPG